MDKENLNKEKDATLKDEEILDQEVKEEKPLEDKEEKTEKEVAKKKKDGKKDDKKKESNESKLEKELKEQKEKYLRLYAEYDNYRKRTQNEKLSIYDDATKAAITELLPMVDSCNMALSQMTDSEENAEFKKGLELITQQLKTCFEKLRVEEFGEVGDKFDANLHNAISKIDDESLDENTISAVYQKGFKIKDKIIRHAMVQVANCD